MKITMEIEVRKTSGPALGGEALAELLIEEIEAVTLDSDESCYAIHNARVIAEAPDGQG